MRQLTEREKENLEIQYAQGFDGKVWNYDDFKLGFIAGLDHQQRKLDAYAAYVAGKITQQELEEIINADPIHDSALLK